MLGDVKPTPDATQPMQINERNFEALGLDKDLKKDTEKIGTNKLTYAGAVTYTYIIEHNRNS